MRIESHLVEAVTKMGKINSTIFYGRDGRSSLASSTYDADYISGLIMGSCLGLTHGQKFGVSYMASPPDIIDDPSNDHNESSDGRIHSVIYDQGPGNTWIDTDSRNPFLGMSLEKETLEGE
ncbi:hypothetical protein MLD38_010230 [Melastoma candidum]|uniref:Uncharacterized protein n=1 Tax=Melastoma candidum TaxID=119954 RepID=A0ACB9QYQ9_9MYRT|nr:hypothetical protein MLD38_010230 [Melastoma candidum]